MTDPRIDRLQDVTARLRSGRPLTTKIVHRQAGAISRIDEEQIPFEPDKLLREGERLNDELCRAGLVNDESILHATALLDFIDAAVPHVAPESLPGSRRTRWETRDRLIAAGVTLS